MLDVSVLYLSIAIAVVPAALAFLFRKQLDSVICLCFAAVGSAMVFAYLGQTLAAQLQLFVFVGGMTAYLVIAAASDGREAKPGPGRAQSALYLAKFLAAAVAIAAVMSVGLWGAGSGQQAPAGNSFSSAAEGAFAGGYALLFASVFLLFASAAGSVLVTRRFLKMVV